MLDLHDLTLAGLAGELAQRRVSSREATNHALRRIAALDGREQLNAYLTVLPERARTEADAADARRAAGRSLGPLDGVPIALKDLFDTAGVPTTAASRVFAGRVPAEDATVVRKLAEAGAVLLGKTNLMEFAYGHPHPAYGETRNPWDSTRTAGGSSGGSAAAIAAGLAWGTFGSDTGGSIRSPAAYCGVTGLKPTFGLVSCAGVIPLSPSLDHAGPITRTAEDAALLLAAVAGHDQADTNSAPVARADAVVKELGELLTDPGWATRAKPLRGLRIGVVPRLFDLAVTPGMRETVGRAVPTLAELGTEIIEVDLSPEVVDLLVPTIGDIYPAEAAAYHHHSLEERPEDYGPTLRGELEAASRLPAYRYVLARQAQTKIAAAFAALYERVDLLAWPAQPIVAPPLGSYDATQDPAAAGSTIEVEIAATGPANLTGEPAISVPCGHVDGLPVGLHLQGPRFADATVLRAAIAYQSATGVPPLARETFTRETTSDLPRRP